MHFAVFILRLNHVGGISGRFEFKGSLFISKILTLHAWFARSLLKVRVSLTPNIKLEKNKWSKLFFLTPCAIKKENIKHQSSAIIKLSTFASLRDAFNFLPWLLLTPERNDFDHVLGYHFSAELCVSRHTINKAMLFIA